MARETASPAVLAVVGVAIPAGVTRGSVLISAPLAGQHARADMAIANSRGWLLSTRVHERGQLWTCRWSFRLPEDRAADRRHRVGPLLQQASEEAQAFGQNPVIRVQEQHRL